MGKKLIVIGAVAGGMSAASAARRLNASMEITVFEKGEHISYSACGIPYFISGEVNRVDNLIVYTPRFFQEKRNIQVRTFHEVIAIYPAKRIVAVKNLNTGDIREHWFSHLVIATGAEPLNPKIPGGDLKGIFTVRNLHDAIKIKDWMEVHTVKNALILGGGFIGLEMTEALTLAGTKVSLAEKQARLLSGMDSQVSEMTHEELKRNQVDVYTGNSVTRFIGSAGSVTAAILENGLKIPVEMVILGVGIKPATQLAKSAGFNLGQQGAIAVNQKLQTSFSGIYAAGDCAETFHTILGKNTYLPLGTTANKQGQVAGSNLCGVPATFKGSCGSAIVKVFDLEIARTGLSQMEADRNSTNLDSAAITHKSKAHYMRGMKPIYVKLMADRRTGRLLGAEMAGGDMGKRIDVLTTAIHSRMTVPEIAALDLCYAPPFSPAWDPILIAARELLKTRP